MNSLFSDIGYKSVNKHGEELCGDHIEVVDSIDNSEDKIIVLADGLGSGVKANILATLTSKILSTMTANGMSLEECVDTVVQTLPICQVRKVAYSTFSLIKITNNEEAEIIQYDNPKIILIRDHKNVEIPSTKVEINGKAIYKSKISLQIDDVFVAISDGALYAGIGDTYNFGWQRDDIISFMEPLTYVNYTAKTLAALLIDECNTLYGNKPGDDTSALVVKIKKREPINLLFGPSKNIDETTKMLMLFFAKEGKHIVCGGTTSKCVAAYLKKPLIPNLDFLDPDIPPTANIEGVDLVTEGVITINKVLEYANDYVNENECYIKWSSSNDAASKIARLLFEEATDINFYVGRAINPAHQNPNLPINFNIKMQLVKELSNCLTKMGKLIKVSYF